MKNSCPFDVFENDFLDWLTFFLAEKLKVDVGYYHVSADFSMRSC